MTRYILEPFVVEEGFESDSFILTPTEGFQKQSREIQLPKGLMSFKKLCAQVIQKNRMRKLFLQLNKSDIHRNKDGHVCCRNITLDNVDFVSAIMDSCNGVFKEKYEDFYCLLRRCGITF